MTAWKLEGLADLNSRLKDLETDIATKIGQAADRAGAVVLAKAIAAAAPIGPMAEGAEVTRRGRKVEHHKIVNSVKVKKTRNETPTKVQTTVTTTAAVQSIWEEFGSIHNAPTRFMSRAVEARTQDAIDQIAVTLKNVLQNREHNA